MTTINTIEDLIRIIEENPEWLDRIRNLILTDDLLRLPERFNEFAERTDRRLSVLDDRQDRFDDRQDRFEARMDRLTDDVGVLKGAHASSVAVGDYEVIAIEMGFTSASSISRGEVYRMGMSPAVEDFGRDALRSFREADLVIRATDDAGRTHYIAVEASYTINGRDTDRAIRNAEILARVTGYPAVAAVCGYEVDNSVREKIESGAVHWRQLMRKDLAPR